MAARSPASRRDVRLLAVLTAVMLAGCTPMPPAAASAVDPTASVAAQSRPPESATPSAIVTAVPGRTAEPATSPDATATPGSAPVGPAANPQRAAPAASLYRIEIPRLGISLPVAEGDVPRDIVQEKTPENYAFHLPGTSWFDAGNTYIYAHARVGMFLNLWNARVGDAVTVRTPNGAREYVVAEVHPRVPPTETVWAGPTSDTRLTLQTSTGPNSDDPRFVVVARPR